MKLGGPRNRFARRNPHRKGRFSACFSGGDHEWLPALLPAVMREGFMLLLIVFLSSLVAAQTPTPQIVPGRERVAPIITRFQTVLDPLSARSFVPPGDPRKSAGHFSSLIVRTYERDQGLENFSRIDRVKKLFLTQSGLPLFQLCGGRLRLDGFTSRLRMQNAQLGPPAVGGLQNPFSPRQGYPVGPRFYGLSLRFPFGRDTQIGGPTETWRGFARLVRAPR